MWTYRQALRVACMLAVAAPLFFSAAAVAVTTDATLAITSEECVVDAVDNGETEVLRVSPSHCETILSGMLTSSAVQSGAPGSQLSPTYSFGGAAGAQTLVAHPTNARPSSRSSLTTDPKIGPISQSVLRTMALVGGVSMAIVTTAFGMDFALFDLRMSRFILRR